jgi:hypothetical protein
MIWVHPMKGGGSSAGAGLATNVVKVDTDKKVHKKAVTSGRPSAMLRSPSSSGPGLSGVRRPTIDV